MYRTASALREFRDRTGTEGDWVGALQLAEATNDLKLIREALFLIGERIGAFKVRG